MAESATERPKAADVAHLRASDAMGAAYTLLCAVLTGSGVALSVVPAALGASSGVTWLSWAVGQGVLAVALLQWFVLLHECGHGVLFRRPGLNRGVGHLAGFFSTIPYAAWQPVHFLHHKWAGWQDLDPTTQSLVPRELKAGERALMNLCWRLWIPAFTVIYRVSNFWILPRLATMDRVDPGRVRANVVGLVVAYGFVVVAVGPIDLFWAVGPAAGLSLMLVEPIMMSQHTHVPQRLSGGEPVSAFAAADQVPFTRSLDFGGWVSRYLLVGFDAHELHHAYPAVPGYRLSQVGWTPPGVYPGWRWIGRVRAMRGSEFLFRNRDQTGADV